MSHEDSIMGFEINKTEQNRYDYKSHNAQPIKGSDRTNPAMPEEFAPSGSDPYRTNDTSRSTDINDQLDNAKERKEKLQGAKPSLGLVNEAVKTPEEIIQGLLESGAGAKYKNGDLISLGNNDIPYIKQDYEKYLNAITPDNVVEILDQISVISTLTGTSCNVKEGVRKRSEKDTARIIDILEQRFENIKNKISGLDSEAQHNLSNACTAVGNALTNARSQLGKCGKESSDYFDNIVGALSEVKDLISGLEERIN